MPIIRPISDLRNNFSSISEAIHTDDEPIFLTKYGVGDMVVMSIEYFERQMARIELYQKLNDEKTEIANGAKGKNAQNVIQGFMSK